MKCSNCNNLGIYSKHVICRSCDASGEPCSRCNKGMVIVENYCNCKYGHNTKETDKYGWHGIKSCPSCKAVGVILYSEEGYLCDDCGHEF